MITVSKGVLKAKMLEYFRQVEESGDELVVTSHNRPVLKVVPIAPKKSPQEVFGSLRGKVKYRGNLLDPETGMWEEV